MSAGFLERLRPREFLDVDRLFKPIPCDAEIREWRIPERVLRNYGYHQILGYTSSGAVVRVERAGDETIWLFIGRKSPKKLFASRIPALGACQFLVRAGFDLPGELKEFVAPVRSLQWDAENKAGASQDPVPIDKMLPRKVKRGRPRYTDPEKDRRIADASKTGAHKSLEDVGRAFGITKDDVIRAKDRHRKRPGSAGKTLRRKPRQVP
jgi:hypothetical protein